jgi:hypothetical protein
MTGDELIAEGRRLARPCVLLKTTGTRPAAWWRGEGLRSAGPDERHLLTLDLRFVPGAPAGCASVFTNEADCEGGAVHFETGASLPAVSAAMKLYAEEALVLPPIEVVFRLGADCVGQWLHQCRWRRDIDYNDNFPDRGPTDAYLRAYMAEYPLYSGTTEAVIGGWHFPWPDGDWASRMDQRLLLCTFRDSEPWVEVWERGQGWEVIQRVT